MSTTISGSLHDFDTKDTYEKLRVARRYTYTLRATGGGKLRFKLKYYSPPELAEAGNGEWYVLEDRSKIAGGTTLNGSFTVPETWASGKTSLKFIFSRGALTEGVEYEFYMEPA